MPFAPNLDNDSKRSLVRVGYDAIAEHYLALAMAEDHPGAPRRVVTDEVLSGLAAGATVLEIGCGPGVPVGKLVMEAGFRYVGVDVSSSQIDLARASLGDAELIVSDALALEVDEGSVAAVFMLYALTHVPREQWLTLFRRIHGWLQDEGACVVNVPLKSVPGWLEEDFLGSGTTNFTNSFGPDETAALLEAAGLRIRNAERHPERNDDPQGWMWFQAARAGRSQG